MDTGGDCSVKESCWWMGEWTRVLLAEQGWSCSHSSVLGPHGESYQEPSELSELPLLVLAVEEVEAGGGPLQWPSCLLPLEPGRLGVEADSRFGENLSSCTGPEASSRRRGLPEVFVNSTLRLPSFLITTRGLLCSSKASCSSPCPFSACPLRSAPYGLSSYSSDTCRLCIPHPEERCQRCSLGLPLVPFET